MYNQNDNYDHHKNETKPRPMLQNTRALIDDRIDGSRTEPLNYQNARRALLAACDSHP